MSVRISQMCFELGPNAGAWSRELNPYFADGGSGMPSAKTAVDKAVAATAVGKGDGGVAWLTKVRYSLFNGNNNCQQNCSWHNCKYNNCQPNCSWYYCELVKTTTNCRTASGLDYWGKSLKNISFISSPTVAIASGTGNNLSPFRPTLSVSVVDKVRERLH